MTCWRVLFEVTRWSGVAPLIWLATRSSCAWPWAFVVLCFQAFSKLALRIAYLAARGHHVAKQHFERGTTLTGRKSYWTLAVLIPIKNEDIRTLAVRVDHMCDQLADVMAPDRVDVYILSDSTEREIIENESAEFPGESRRESNIRVFYRRREEQREAKKGNIEEFMMRAGNKYTYFIILDADSYVEPCEVLGAVRQMEETNDIGIVQMRTNLWGAETIHAAWAMWLRNCEVAEVAKAAADCGAKQSAYCGHNAVVRTAPFLANCILPKIPLGRPLGGNFMSHDYAEAIMMGNAGFTVAVDSAARGAIEEHPPTCVDDDIRSCRWLQGDIQHFWLFLDRRLKLATRRRILFRTVSLISRPLVSMIVFGAAITQILAVGEDGSGNEGSVFGWILVATAGALYLTFRAVIGVLLVAGKKRGVQEKSNLVGASIVVGVMAGIFAGIRRGSELIDLAKIFLGGGVDWTAQRRQASGKSDEWRRAVAHYWLQSVIGLAAVSTALATGNGRPSPVLVIFLPAIIAIPFAVFTARKALSGELQRQAVYMNEMR